MIEFTIPGNPIPQARPRAGKRGNKIIMYDPKESKEYKKYVSLIAKQYAPNTLLEGPLSIQIKIYRQMPKSMTKKAKSEAVAGIKRPLTKPDVSNYVKGIEDALNGIIYQDDSQIVRLDASKYYSENPRVEIRIQEMDIYGDIS